MSVFTTIVADPPWPYSSTGAHIQDKSGGRNADGRGANVSSSQRYGKMSMAELKALQVPSATNAHLYLWTTNAFMVEAHELARAWGFEPKTILTWLKVRRDDYTKPSMKSGYYFRGATEHVVFAVKGSLKLREKRALPTGYMWCRLPHSMKPPAFYSLVRVASPGPYLEMFARHERPGWERWGNEVESTVEIEARRHQWMKT